MLKKRVCELLTDGLVRTVIGYGENSRGGVRAVFIRTAQESEGLIFDSRCKQNLAVYLLKPEVKKMGKPAIIAHDSTLRTILQLAAEKQVAEGDLVALAADAGNGITVCESLEKMEQYLAKTDQGLSAEDREQLQKIEKMPLAERWQYWQEKLSRCFKCYACRAACPLCYCPHCTVECNQPQWISVPAHDLGNLEWHLMRAMHLAGRCVGCGECSRACPLDIPVHLLSQKLNEEIFRQFSVRAGLAVLAEHALSTFKPDDKESFIR